MRHSLGLGLVFVLGACTTTTINRTTDEFGGSGGSDSLGAGGKGAGVGELVRGNKGASSGGSGNAGGVGASVASGGGGGTGAGPGGGGFFSAGADNGGEDPSGNGGASGATGASGGAGSVAPLPCSSIKACSDSADPSHCECFVLESGKCGLRAKDADKDGYRDQGCKEEPSAKDCNDSLGTVYPGAAEVCDGVDNDCNGKADLDDGLELAGSAGLLVPKGYDPKIAWSGAANSFGLAWRIYNAKGNGDVGRFQRISAEGKFLGQPSIIACPSADYPCNLYMLAVSEGDSGFGILYLLQIRSQTGEGGGTFFQRINTQGELLGDPVLLSSQNANGPVYSVGDLQQGAAGSWLAFWSESKRVQGAQLDFDNTGIRLVGPKFVSSPSATYTQMGVHAARSAGQVYMAYSEGGTDIANGSLYSMRYPTGLSAADTTTSTTLNQDLDWIAVGGNSVGYAMAWGSTQGRWRFREMDHSGGTVCGPVDLLSPQGGGAVGGLVSRGQQGWLIGTAEPSALPSTSSAVLHGVKPIGANCGVSGGIQPLSSAEQPSQLESGTLLASSSTSMAAIWWAGGTDNGIYARFMGDQLCNAAR